MCSSHVLVLYSRCFLASVCWLFCFWSLRTDGIVSELDPSFPHFVFFGSDTYTLALEHSFPWPRAYLASLHAGFRDRSQYNSSIVTCTMKIESRRSAIERPDRSSRRHTPILWSERFVPIKPHSGLNHSHRTAFRTPRGLHLDRPPKPNKTLPSRRHQLLPFSTRPLQTPSSLTTLNDLHKRQTPSPSILAPDPIPQTPTTTFRPLLVAWGRTSNICLKEPQP